MAPQANCTVLDPESLTTPALIFGVTHEVPITSLAWDAEAFADVQFSDQGEALFTALVNGSRDFMPVCFPRPDGLLCVQGFIQRAYSAPPSSLAPSQSRAVLPCSNPSSHAQKEV